MLKKIFLIVIFNSIFLSGQTQIEFANDISFFRGDSTSTLMEIYYSIDTQTLTQKITKNKKFIDAVFNLKISDNQQKNVFENNWLLKTEVLSEKNSRQVGKIGILLEPGNYTLNFKIEDKFDSSNVSTTKKNIFVPDIKFSSPIVGGLQISANISASENKSSMFYKNGYEIIPNPELFYSQKIPVLFYYGELYNLQKLKGSSYRVLQEIIDVAAAKKIHSKFVTKAKKVNNTLEVGIVKLADFNGGKYLLKLSLVDADTNVISSVAKTFFYYSSKTGEKKFATNDREFLESRYAIIGEAECEEYFGIMKYIALKDEVDRYKSLSELEGKRRFLYQFWKKRDEKPNTPQNETEIEFFKRKKAADNLYKHKFKKGSKTDRGRVYVLLGKPDYIERHLMDNNSKPYVIWRYHNVEGGVYFVFSDLYGTLDFQLLHSTKRGEVGDPEWKKRVILMGEALQF